MSKSITEIHWLAGILEGEGCFNFQAGSPRIMVATVDLDVIERIRIIVNSKNPFNISRTTTGKELYKLTLCGSLAIQWLMTLYPLMSIRRKQKIRDVISIWKNIEGNGVKTKARNNIIKGLEKLGFSEEKIQEKMKPESVN